MTYVTAKVQALQYILLQPLVYHLSLILLQTKNNTNKQQTSLYMSLYTDTYIIIERQAHKGNKISSWKVQFNCAQFSTVSNFLRKQTITYISIVTHTDINKWQQTYKATQMSVAIHTSVHIHSSRCISNDEKLWKGKYM